MDTSILVESAMPARLAAHAPYSIFAVETPVTAGRRDFRHLALTFTAILNHP